jgi:orotidine-5'-phosphate decarboxylase
MAERREPKDRLIVALDVETPGQAENLVDRLHGVATTFKVGSQLFTAAGPRAVELVHKKGGRVFLDLKYHDIPNTVAGSVRAAARLGVFMLNVHASGGLAMLKAAAEARGVEGKATPILLAVTVLTSLDRSALQRELNVPLSVEGHALQLARLAKTAGLDGCVAAPPEIGTLRRALGREWVIVTPGVRPTEGGSEADDQARVATPEAAVSAGADYIVVGRPILEAADPARAAAAIIEAIARA